MIAALIVIAQNPFEIMAVKALILDRVGLDGDVEAGVALLAPVR
jgi:hypothetical protein